MISLKRNSKLELVEALGKRTHNTLVPGSSPGGTTNKHKAFRGLFF